MTVQEVRLRPSGHVHLVERAKGDVVEFFCGRTTYRMQTTSDFPTGVRRCMRCQEGLLSESETDPPSTVAPMDNHLAHLGHLKAMFDPAHFHHAAPWIAVTLFLCASLALIVRLLGRRRS